MFSDGLTGGWCGMFEEAGRLTGGWCGLFEGLTGGWCGLTGGWCEAIPSTRCSYNFARTLIANPL